MNSESLQVISYIICNNYIMEIIENIVANLNAKYYHHSLSIEIYGSDASIS
jgi:hypothetical protein